MDVPLAELIRHAPSAEELSESSVALLAVSLGARVSFTYRRSDSGVRLRAHLEFFRENDNNGPATTQLFSWFTEDDEEYGCASRALDARRPYFVEEQDAADAVDRLMRGCVEIVIWQSATNFYMHRFISAVQSQQHRGGC